MSNNESGLYTAQVTVALFNPRPSLGELERLAIDGAVNAVQCEQVSKDLNARTKEGRGCVSRYIAACALAGTWSAARKGFMDSVDAAAAARGVQLKQDGMTDKGKAIKGWRSGSTIAVYCSNGVKVEQEYAAAVKREAEYAARVAAGELKENPFPNPFNADESLGSLFRIASAQQVAVEQKLAAIAAGQVGLTPQQAEEQDAKQQAERIEAERMAREQREHVERVEKAPELVALGYLAKIRTILAEAKADSDTVAELLEAGIIGALGFGNEADPVQDLLDEAVQQDEQPSIAA